ncbi:hypothetical protein [Thiobacter aerophilum]|uniref:Uncharacterized protein n=1 Tax=Thiobacter aerophilum TaxID=3121275 RepID=A0ABV0EG78_9BURK
MVDSQSGLGECGWPDLAAQARGRLPRAEGVAADMHSVMQASRDRHG